MSGATETSELSPQSLTASLAEGDRRVTENLTQNNRPGGDEWGEKLHFS